MTERPIVQFTKDDNTAAKMIEKVRHTLQVAGLTKRLSEFEEEIDCMKCYRDCLTACFKYCDVQEVD